jgi:hypothetical protein
VQRREETAHRRVIRIHRAADVHEQQHTDVVLPRRAEDQLDLAGVATRLVDGLVQVELGLRAGPGELAEALQRHAELADVERDVGAVVTEAALLGHLHGRAAPALPADADPRRVLAAVAVGRLAAGADPAAAAVVALVLLRERLEELPHELVRREALQRGQLLGREIREVLRVAEPVEQLLRELVAESAFDALEDLREDAVVGVEERPRSSPDTRGRGDRSEAGSTRAGPPRARAGTSATPGSRRGHPPYGGRRTGRGTSYWL